jgi:uncharacterized repeat protein (TIGR01451 family)
MKKSLKIPLRFLFVLIFLFTHLTFGFTQNIMWQKCLGGNITEIFNTATATGDGGALVVGISHSTSGDLANVPQDFGNGVWLVKLSANNKIEWQKRFGSTGDDEGRSVLQTQDGGYLVAGFYREQTLIVGCTRSSSIWLLKLSPTGTIETRKCFGGDKKEFASKLIKTIDGGYLLLGNTESNDGDASGNHGAFDGWVIKLSSSLNIEWQKCLGGSANDYMSSVVQTSDGGYIVGGETQSNDGDAGDNHGDADAWVVKLSETGAIEWKKCFGGTKKDYITSIVQTSDKNYVFAGSTLSNDGDIRGQHGQSQDIWLVKISSTGNIIWQKCLGGDEWEQANDMVQMKDGSFVIAGMADSNNGDVQPNKGLGDSWLVKVSPSGALLWQKTLGGSRTDAYRGVIETADNNLLAVGWSSSVDLDMCPHTEINIKAMMAKISTGTTTITKSIAGYTERTNATCQPVAPPQYRGHTALKIEKNNATYYTSSDSIGRYGIIVDTGRYNLTAIAPNHLWTSCGAQTVNVLNPAVQDTTFANPRLYINANCPLLEVQLTTPVLVRCFNGQYFIHYANRGTAVKNNAVLEFNLDTTLTFISASRPFATRTNNKFTFNIGNIGIGEEGQIIITVLVNCTNPLGLIHCSSAQIANVLPCETALDTLPTITTPCVNGCRDSIIFVVKKPISGQNLTFKYRLYAEYFIIDTGRFTLTNPATIKHIQDNKTYRLEVLDLNNQLVAARFIQNNSRDVAFQEGIGTQFISALKLTNVADNCTFNRGSYDPNDKSAQPTGIGAQHLIEQGKMLDYLVRFQNTGTFMAFNVVIKDTLPPYFDLSSLKITAKSHAATWQLDPKGILTMTFKDINLIDSFTNEPASNGFFRYQIRLKDSIVTGTQVKNRAAIYFDFNEPVITNYTEHTIGKELVKDCLAKPTVKISILNCANRNVTFGATAKSAGNSPTFEWYRNKEPVIKSPSFILANASNGTKIYCKMTVSSEICTETPVITSDTLIISCVNTPTTDIAIIDAFEVYPNPNDGVFDVKVTLAISAQMQIDLLNTLGQILDTKTFKGNGITQKYDVSYLPKGIYFIKLNIDGHTMTKKIVLNR